MELLNSPTELRSKILEEAKKIGLTEPCYQKMLDYTIKIFETNGLGTEYYGYHNINHELEVTLGILLIGNNRKTISKLSDDDLKYLFVAALFHDLDPQKYVDKPHEKNVLEHIVIDSTIKDLISQSNLDLEIIKALILRTTYPWTGEVKKLSLIHI